MIWFIGFVLACALLLYLYLTFNPQFGGPIDRATREKYARSKHWNGKQFENLVETTMNFSLASMPKFFKDQFTDVAARSPKKPIPVLPFPREKYSKNPSQPKFIWYGHAVLLLQLNGKNILIDPMLGPDASPVGPIRTKRFSENTLALIDDFPRIDVMMMTHDHYDHLDYESILLLKEKVDTFYVALGVQKHLVKWGVPSEQITEFDWWDQLNFEGIEITYTPSRHFSGRALSDRFKCLWGGWVFKTTDHSVYWTGDGGYGDHFKTVGDKLGPFDWAFVECGQYNLNWKNTHMFPEEAVHAGIDSKSKTLIPFHWGGFALAQHSWKDPILRFIEEADKQKVKYATPRIGELIVMDEEKTEKWFEELE